MWSDTLCRRVGDSVLYTHRNRSRPQAAKVAPSLAKLTSHTAPANPLYRFTILADNEMEKKK